MFAYTISQQSLAHEQIFHINIDKTHTEEEEKEEEDLIIN